MSCELFGFGFGFGFGFVNAPITNAVVSGMPVSQAGVASSPVSTFRQTGGVLGVAVLGAVVASRLGPLVYTTSYPAAARPPGGSSSDCGVTVTVVGRLTNRPRARSPRPRQAAGARSANRTTTPSAPRGATIEERP
ncbi:hypothetical protein [Streptomyces sp. GbtcB6]|uniref:hypothetical protein n=1 Tax=Streptomyces sp. GbtcB6 TaxID=2824751 RepID=UPI001C2F1DA8|nr:hypothetical protein [Streptomyces sp. GbtcB6]